MSATSERSGLVEMLSSLKQLEDRISRIEEHLGLQPAQEESNRNPQQEQRLPQSLESDEALESQIGETLFARVGILVLAIGIAFLLTFPFHGLPPLLPSLFGYVIVAGTWWLSRQWRVTLPSLSHYLLGAALVMLYFASLRLAFFSAEPALQNRDLELALLLGVVTFSGVVSAHQRSPFLAAISFTEGCITALIGGEPLFVFTLCAAVCLGAAYFARRNSWIVLLIAATGLAYVTHFIWALNNPVMGNESRLVSPSPVSALFVLSYVLILASGTLFRPPAVPEKGLVAIVPFVNGVTGFALYFFMTAPAHGAAVSFYHGAASLVFLLLATLFWIRERSRQATFIYAMLGYLAMSVAIIAVFPSPEYFVWLACQSLLVISTAIWFRSRFIVGSNFVIYVLLFVAYLILAGTAGGISIIFGMVALLSARILNWQKDRLLLKTEMMRNAYLVSAFFIIPYALYHIVPRAYVSTSWVAVALFYYVMSILLRDNRKYRWMALLTLCLTVGFVFVVDLVNLDAAFRILSFLVLGIALFWISLLYARKRSVRQQEDRKLSLANEIQHSIHEP